MAAVRVLYEDNEKDPNIRMENNMSIIMLETHDVNQTVNSKDKYEIHVICIICILLSRTMYEKKGR